MKKSSQKKKEKFISYLIKSCETYDLNVKDSIDSINKILDKDSISRRTYFNYKKKVYENGIFKRIRNGAYDNPEVKLVILSVEMDDEKLSLKTDKLIVEQFPDKKSILEDEERLVKRVSDATKMINKKLKKYNEISQYYSLGLDNAISNKKIREEYIKCGKPNCNQCPHGPYQYVYWNEKNGKGNITRKKYIG